MKKSELKQIIKEELKKSLNETYYRLDDKIGKNFLFVAHKNLMALSSSINSGKDMNMEKLEGIITLLDMVKKKITKHN